MNNMKSNTAIPLFGKNDFENEAFIKCNCIIIVRVASAKKDENRTEECGYIIEHVADSILKENFTFTVRRVLWDSMIFYGMRSSYDFIAIKLEQLFSEVCGTRLQTYYLAVERDATSESDALLGELGHAIAAQNNFDSNLPLAVIEKRIIRDHQD